MHFHSHSFLANSTLYLQAGKQNLHVLDILQLQINDSPHNLYLFSRRPFPSQSSLRFLEVTCDLPCTKQA